MGRQNFRVVEVTLASAVVTSGTFTVTYPDGTNAAWFQKGMDHKITALGAEFSHPEDFGITTFGNTTCTVTWRNAKTLAAGTKLRVKLDTPGLDSYRDKPPVFTDPSPALITTMYPQRISLGAPIVADVDGVATAMPTSGAYTLNGASVTSGVAVMDVPRNVTFTATGTFTGATITGKDVYLSTMIETVAANGGASTVAAGVKAFKTITSIVSLATAGGVSTCTAGFGDVLGLPVYLPSSGFVIRELEDGATASSGTIVAGLTPTTVSTATTADVRGTYDPSSACNGTKAFELLVTLSDPNHKGNPQYDG
jgi:hypothetical protein